MSERLPSRVVCCACEEIVPITGVRRYITLWARPGGGGSLNGIKDQHAEDLYRCDDCVRLGRLANQPAQEATLL